MASPGGWPAEGTLGAGSPRGRLSHSRRQAHAPPAPETPHPSAAHTRALSHAHMRTKPGTHCRADPPMCAHTGHTALHPGGPAGQSPQRHCTARAGLGTAHPEPLCGLQPLLSSHSQSGALAKVPRNPENGGGGPAQRCPLPAGRLTAASAPGARQRGSVLPAAKSSLAVLCPISQAWKAIVGTPSHLAEPDSHGPRGDAAGVSEGL